MPRFSFQLESGDTSCELQGIDLPDAECAETFVIDLIAELFRRGEVFDGADWSICSVHVIGENEREVFTRTAGEIALRERELRRDGSSQWLVN